MTAWRMATAMGYAIATSVLVTSAALGFADPALPFVAGILCITMMTSGVLDLLEGRRRPRAYLGRVVDADGNVGNLYAIAIDGSRRPMLICERDDDGVWRPAKVDR